MIVFFGDPDQQIFALDVSAQPDPETIKKLSWLFGNKPLINASELPGPYLGPRASMISPWSTNAVEITQNMGISGITRIEKFSKVDAKVAFDPMVSQKHSSLRQEMFEIQLTPEPILEVADIASYNKQEGLALSDEEVLYLESMAARLGRALTDSEVFGFSQVNSEHCRHKIFNGTFVIDGEEQPASLFSLIKETSKRHPNFIVSAYKDNVAFIEGPVVTQFAPEAADRPSWYEKKTYESVISIKAETHNFPTTVEAFNGAATGAGGEIRDRLAGGRGSIPLAGTALYMTPYSRLTEDRVWEQKLAARKWLYQTPIDILIKASNGASDFGNKFGQPLINGSVLTFEHKEADRTVGYDKVIMMAGGIGYGKAEQAKKGLPQKNDNIVILGGDNYRIGMGGAAVSSAEGGEFSSGIELNAVQRSNPEMQKRTANAIRAMVELGDNPIVSIHDHGAGGHLNCLSELVEDTGGFINLDQLPVGDPTLSAKEIIGNESQERMGLIIRPESMDLVRGIAERERSPVYEVGKVTADDHFTIMSMKTEDCPMDLKLSDMFGSSPKTILRDKTTNREYKPVTYNNEKIHDYLEQVLRLEAVGCKDWLTNKVDRCVGGRVAKQQCCGPLQLPLNNCGVMALDYDGLDGIATSMGHAPVIGLIDPIAAARMAITEALTNIVWAPMKHGLRSISLSANWMWPAKNDGEDARLYEAVKAVSEFAIELGINIPTGKDSMSMKQKYPDGEVYAPGTVVISAAAHCDDITGVVEPVLKKSGGDIYYINLSQDAYKLGGSSLAQILNKIGDRAPSVNDATRLANAVNKLQELIHAGQITAGHDISSGGLITCLLELCFSDNQLGAAIDLTELQESDLARLLFSENAGLIIQSSSDMTKAFGEVNVHCIKIGQPTEDGLITVTNYARKEIFDVAKLRDSWFETSYLLDDRQTQNGLAQARYNNYKAQALDFVFPEKWTATIADLNNSEPRPKAAIIREKGSNSERELAHAMYLAGFDVKDVHMTDLISGREDLTEIQFIGAVGGFSNSDVLGSAKGWAGAFLYNPKAKKALEAFFEREDVLSVGICNGCQLFLELDLINPEHEGKDKMTYNKSGKHESNFTSVEIIENNSVMLNTLAGTKLGVWISHGEGRFSLPMPESDYGIVAKYGYKDYPANPNGSDYNTAMLCSPDGRHLATMPHIERSIFKWNWAHYPDDQNELVSPWIAAFVNARNWINNKNKG